MYWKSPSGNFGDDLNEWIWDDLLPGWRSWQPDWTLVGVGTVLSSIHFRADRRYLICGSGTGFGQPPDVSDARRWRIAFVRGSGTAARMNLPEEMAISDPAILIPSIARFSGRQQARGTAFIPHCDSDASPIYDWDRICRAAGLNYVSPRRDSHQVIRAIISSEAVITESMHGAIIADSFRVPWKPVRLVGNFNTFKWEDWASGLGLSFRIAPLPAPTIKQIPRIIGRLKHSFLRHVVCTGSNSRIVGPGLAEVARARTRDAMSSALRTLAKDQFYLSEQADLTRTQEKLRERIQWVAAEYGRNEDR